MSQDSTNILWAGGRKTKKWMSLERPQANPKSPAVGSAATLVLSQDGTVQVPADSQSHYTKTMQQEATR